jgi:N-acetylmuramoyl-L-alanine amidase
MSFKSIVKNNLMVLLILGIAQLSIFASNPYEFPVKTVFIDPGHGGNDSGASRAYDFLSYKLDEKDITLKLANKVSFILKSRYPDINVYQTRIIDEYLSLQERSEVCYLTPLPPKTSCIYISLHVNASTNTSANGFEVFTKLPPSEKTITLFDDQTPKQNIPFFSTESNDELNEDMYEKSIEIAHDIDESIAESFPSATDRGVKNDNLYVLNVARAPGVLIEVAFISNEDEAKQLVDENYLNQMALAISDGISKSL